MSSSSTSVKSKMPAKKSDASKIAPVSVVVTAAPAAPAAQKAKKEKKPAAASKAAVTVPTVETPSAAAVVEVVESSDVILAGLAEKLKTLGTELTTRVREATKSVSDAIKATKREARLSGFTFCGPDLGRKTAPVFGPCRFTDRPFASHDVAIRQYLMA